MKDFSIHILSKDSANVYINGTFVSLIDNYENFSIDLKMYNDTLIITKEPISSKNLLLPYTVKLTTKANKLECDSEFVEIVPYKNNQYDVILKECEVKNHKPLRKVYDEYVSQFNVIVVNDGTSYINIYENNSVKYSATTQEINTVSSEQKHNCLLVKGITNNNKYFVLVLDQNFEELFSDEVEKIEENDDEIKILKKINDIAKHATVKTINLEDTAITDEYYVYLKKDAMMTNEAKLVPYAFLEAIKVKNFNLAKKYLTLELSTKTNDEHLEYYFKNLNKIYYNPYNNNEYLINYTVLCDNYKSFNFTVINNKIDEIEEVDL